jgi:WD40-like Beta Propeller Repeat
MKRTTKLVLALWAMFVAHTAFAQKGTEQQLEKDANALFSKGEYLKAFPMFSQLVSLYPNHLDYNYKFGACAIYSEPDKSKAIRYLNIATTKGVEDPMAWYYLGKAYHLNYQFRESIKSYEAFLRKADPKIAAKTDAQREIETCIYGSNLLANIKDLTVINKTEADKESFFRYFNLEGIGGKILTLPAELKTKLDLKATDPGVIHYPGTGTTIFFSSYGKDGSTGKDIYKAEVLPDGKFSTPEMVKGDVNTKYDEDYCFMHSDGKTLYFASKGHNSMGGYDIFKCVYDYETGEFGPAINLDFAINTPDDDIFFIADSLNQRAYFASGRTSDQNHLHVYNVMVEATPLQIIYLKGDFISEINAEQKKATIKINDKMSGRTIMEGSTNQTNGSYVVYVPGAGEYSFKVITENSPVVHDVSVNIPKFDKPVALRQQMRLVSEGGKDKLIVTNYFETPLNEDLASLAADMLRKKAGLDVNATKEDLAANSKSNENANLSSVPSTMENAPLVAGFGDGTTIKSVVTEIEDEVTFINEFVKESDKKYANSYAYALKKQKEADATLKKAEALRSSTSTYATQQDIDKLRESIALSDKAEELQREAQAAVAAAETVKQYKESEATRAKELQEQAQFLKQAENTQNFKAAVEGLQKENQRQTEIRNGAATTPSSELIAKAKAKEADQQKAEAKLATLREEEKELATNYKLAEDKKNATTKKKDKEQAELDCINLKSALDGVRREIVAQNNKTAKLGEEAKDLYANAAMFDRVCQDTELGLSANEQVKLTETDKTSLSMKLNELDSRVNALEITDPQMLALITDAGSGDVAVKTTRVEPASQIKTRDALSIDSDHKLLMAKGNSPASKRMFIANSMSETSESIASLENKKKTSALNAQEQQELTALTSLRTQLQAEMAANPMPSTTVANKDEVRSTYLAVAPKYNEEVSAINNSGGSEIDRTLLLMEYKQTTLDKLKSARYNNAQQAAVETDATTLSNMALRDQQYDAAIAQLENETASVSQFKAAYETENKSIIESDEVFAGKLQEQITISESYMHALEKVEQEKQEQLDNTSDVQKANSLRAQIAEIRQEKINTQKKLDNYQHDLSLTAATNEPKADSTAVAINKAPANNVVAITSLEDEIEKNEARWNFDSPPSSEGDPQKSRAQIDTEKTEKLFKTREQSESIFAYESNSFEEMVAKQSSLDTELKHRDKIQAINDEIFLIEAEMENEKSETKLRKLDYRAEQLYLRRSLIEIDNATAISIMATKEYESEKKKSDDMVAANEEKIEGRAMIREQISDLQRQAKSNMQEAASLREMAPGKMDDIERADYYREAFAKEALAINQLRQVQDINENIDMLLTYDDQQLLMMRSGKSPDADLAAAIVEDNKTEGQKNAEAIAAGNTVTTDAGNNAADVTNTSNATGNANSTATGGSVNSTANNNTASGNGTNTAANVAANTTNTGNANTTGTTALTDGNNGMTNNANTAANNNTTGSNTASATGATTNGTSNGTTGTNPWESKVYIDKKTITAYYTVLGPDGKPMQVAVDPSNVSNDTNSNVANTANNTGANTAGANSNNAAKNAENTSPEMVAVTKTAAAAKPDATVPASKPSSNSSESNSASSASASAGAYSASEAEAYYFAAPEVLEKDLFVRTTRGVYSESKPIPMDIAMPKGVYFKVQVGAFRNQIPQNLYDEFAPVCGESLNNGVTRYTAGFFKSFDNADQTKKEIRSMGYNDAFVVAFRDGKRIPLYEAMGQSAADFQASVEKEYVYGDKGTAPKAESTPAKTTANTTAPAAKATNYYTLYPEAAKAAQVEEIKGLFYTVQVGVYSRPVPSKSVFYINPLNSELIDGSKIRYTSGRYTSLNGAVDKRTEAKSLGIKDAFITAYYNGKRISLSEADKLIKDNGPSIFITE